MKKSILIKDIDTLVLNDENFTVLNGVDLLIVENRIEKIGEGITPPEGADIINGSAKIVLPGFVNTHHHLYQTLTRVVPAVQNSKLFDWLVYLYEIWRNLTPEAVYVSALVGMSELILTGCTTTSDHFYVFPHSCPDDLLDYTIKAAEEVGIRFFATRGGMSRGKSRGGLPPDDVVQDEEKILQDYERVFNKFHNKNDEMIKIGFAPCSPFSVSEELMKQTVDYARKVGVKCHTHLAETKDEEEYCLEVYGRRPLQLMEDLGWLGNDIWFAHGIYFNDEEILKLGKTKTGVAHCPTSNLRLGSGIAKVPKMLDNGVPVGLGVDGSASNDSSNMLQELKIALLVHRIGTDVSAMPKEKVFKMATKMGAEILGFSNIGEIKEGFKADIIGFDLNDVSYAGAIFDKPAALLFTGKNQTVSFSIINGKLVAWDGQILTINLHEVIKKHNEIALNMVNSSKVNV